MAMMAYHIFKIFVAITFLSCIGEEDCDYKENVFYYVLLMLDIFVVVSWITYIVHVLLQLYWQTHNNFRYEF